MKKRGRRSNDRGASKEANRQLAWASWRVRTRKCVRSKPDISSQLGLVFGGANLLFTLDDEFLSDWFWRKEVTQPKGLK